MLILIKKKTYLERKTASTKPMYSTSLGCMKYTLAVFHHDIMRKCL